MTRRILLTITGLSPQVVTESLYALAVRRDPPWVPDELHVITTATGAESLRLNLLATQPLAKGVLDPAPARIQGLGWFHQLARDYDLPAIAFGPEFIHVVSDGAGRLLDDIRTAEENTAAADQITERVRRLTAAGGSELHVSIAGGRKTMGYYAGYALSLFGRPQDRLSHVLVSDPYEGNRDFYYPTPYSHPVHNRRGDREVTVDARNAAVELAEIPFVSLRHGLPDGLLTGHSTFHATVAAARAVLAPPRLLLNVGNQTVTAAGVQLRLPPSQFALLALFARRAQAGRKPLPAPLKGQPDVQWSHAVLAELREVMGEFGVPDAVEDQLARGVDGDYFSQHLSRLHRSLGRILGPAAASYRIGDGGCRPRRYSLSLSPDAITFISRTEEACQCAR
jgi:CRISPR-associated protein (TIGR02584 family)